MIKKKAKKTAAKKTAKRKSPSKSKKQLNPAEVRKEISRMVESEATLLARAVIDEGKKGQLPDVKYMFEMASIFPAAPNGEQATEEEDCLAKMLLAKISPPKKENEGDAKEEKAEESDGESRPSETTDGRPAAVEAENGGVDKTSTTKGTEDTEAQ